MTSVSMSRFVTLRDSNIYKIKEKERPEDKQNIKDSISKIDKGKVENIYENI